MDETTRLFLSAAIGKALFPLFIALIGAVVLLICRKFIPNWWGEVLFGKYWYRRDQEALREKATQRAASWLRDLSYWLGQQIGRRTRR